MSNLTQKADVLAEVAAILSSNDEASVVPTLVELGVRRAVAGLTEDQQARKDELRAFANDMRTEMVKVLEAESTAIARKIREGIQMDLDKAGASAATLVSNVNLAHSRPARVRWVVIGMLIAGILVAVGIAIGKYLR